MSKPAAGKGQSPRQVPKLAKGYEVKVTEGFRLVAAQQIALGLPTVLDLSRFQLRPDDGAEATRRTPEQLARIKAGSPESGGYDITLGSDEQIVAWLMRRDVDAAVLPTGAFILNDPLRSALTEKPDEDAKAANPLELEERLCLAAYADGKQFKSKEALERWRELGKRCRDAIAASDWKGVTSGWRLIVQGPLSTRGFLVPALHLEAMAGVSLKMTPDARVAFWRELSRIMIFVPNGVMPPGAMPRADAGAKYGRQGETTFVFAPDAATAAELSALGFHFDPGRLEETQPAVVRAVEAANPRVRHSASPGLILLDPGAEIEWLPALNASYRASALHDWMRDDILRKAEWGPKSFLYSLREAALLAKHDAIASGSDALALVLSGGGVKAAYQSALIDGLYGIDGDTPALLANVGSSDDPRQRLRVRWVTGNSGGALLGAFVATLSSDSIKRLRDAGTTLSDVIWKQRPSDVEGPTLRRLGQYVPTTDILPFFDLMRWLSLIAAAAVLCLVLIPGQHPILEEPAEDPATLRRIHTQGLLRSLLWLAMLFFAPFVIRWYTGSAAEEHVPYIQGFLYFACVLIAIGSDQSRDHELTRRDVTPGRPGLRLDRKRRARAAGLVGFAAVVLVALRLLREQPWLSGEVPVLPPISVGAFLGSLAVLAAFWGFHRLLQVYEPDDGFRRPRGFRRVMAFASIPFVVLGLYGLWMALGAPAILELTSTFWLQWLGISFAVSLLARLALELIVRRAEHGGNTSSRKPVGTLYRELRTREDGRFLRLPRYLRIFVFLAMGFGWWNLVMAPGVYGNVPARSFLAQRFRDLIGVHSLKVGKEIEKGLRLRAGFVVPTVSLDEGNPQYFEFRADDVPAGRTGADGEPVESRPANGWELWPTPAAIAAAPEADFGHIADCVQPVFDAVVASGSPFPVFPPHRVTNPFCDCNDDVKQRYGIRTRLKGDTWLVDGGFAHNIPIGSARVVGARQVLVLESSVRGTLPEPTGPSRQGLMGNLASNLGRIVPFLWEHAQASDVQRIEDLFVLHASPEPADSAEWPFLGDFRAGSIEKCLSLGRTEVQNHHRIVTIDSPGRALFRREPPPR